MNKAVVIVGGGISGLGAALRLAAAGCRVTLLEAKERLGGRLRTERRGKIPIDLGAEFLHGREEELFRLIRSARLSSYEVNADSHVRVGQKLKPFDLWEDAEKIISRIDPRKPDTSFAQFLAGQRLNPLRRRLALNYVEGFNAADADCISAHSILKAQQSAERMDGAWQGRLKRGYGGLTRYLERRLAALGVRILRHTTVREIRWRPGAVEVAWRRGGGAGVVRARAAVITVPLGIWQARSIRFTPALPEKQTAADELRFGHVMKFSLLFRERWWPKAGNGFVHAPGEAIPTWWDGAGGLLTGWAGGPRAEALMSQTPSELTALCFEILARIYGERADEIKSRLREMFHYNWARDPHIRGAYSYIPVNGMEWPGVLAAPVADTLFFAGEATTRDAQMGTVFGAHDSGLRAASEILERGK